MHYKLLMRSNINVQFEDFLNYEKWTRCKYPKNKWY